MTPRPLPRLKGAIYMTLIAVYPVANGFVVGADTQETRPSYDAQGNVYELRKAVQKIKPEVMGNYQVAIAGAGHAQLIDTFIVRAQRAISGWSAWWRSRPISAASRRRAVTTGSITCCTARCLRCMEWGQSIFALGICWLESNAVRLKR